MITYFNDHDIRVVCNDVQGNGFSYLFCEGDDYIAQSICKVFQTYMYLLFTNKESHAIIGPSYQNAYFCNYHLTYHFPSTYLMTTIRGQFVRYD